MRDFEKTEAIDIEKINIGKKDTRVPGVKSDYDYKNFKKDLSSSIKSELNSNLENIVKNNFQEKTMVMDTVSDGNSIGIASDHRGFYLKQKLTKHLTKKGYNVIDYGTDSTASCDYPVYGFKLGEAVSTHKVSKGIAICGSGIGISIACNKVKGVRCAKVNNTKEAKWTVHDNDANIIALSCKTPVFRAKDIVDVFLTKQFSNMPRHQKRIDMLNEYGE